MPLMTGLMPVLNVGKLSDGRYKFSFVSSAGTLFSEVSVAKKLANPDARSDEQQQSEALKALLRIARELNIAIQELEQPEVRRK